MSPEAWANLMLILIGLVGLIGILASWPLTLVWIVMLLVGWGVLIVSNSDGGFDL